MRALPDMPKRHDPPSRPVDGSLDDQARLRNTDPDRVYCLANPNDPDTGLTEMLRLGWVQEFHRKGGPMILGGDVASDGAAITLRGSVLVSRGRAEHEAYERQKFAVADQRARSIGQKGGVDAIVGPTGRPAEWKQDPREFVARD